MKESNGTKASKQPNIQSFAPSKKNLNSPGKYNEYSDTLTQSQNQVRYQLDEDNIVSQGSEEEIAVVYKKKNRNGSSPKKKVRYDQSSVVSEAKVSISNDAYMAQSSQHTAPSEEGRRRAGSSS